MLPENVINGFARTVGERMKETTNAWGPDPEVAGPHWVQLTWPEPVTFNMIHVSFQTVDSIPRRFVIEARCDGQWQSDRRDRPESSSPTRAWTGRRR
jgi:hypothetical protein